MLCKLIASYENVDAAEKAVRELRGRHLGVEKAILRLQHSDDAADYPPLMPPAQMQQTIPLPALSLVPSIDAVGETSLLTGQPQTENNIYPQPVPFLGARWASASLHHSDTLPQARLEVLCAARSRRAVASVLRNSGAFSVNEKKF